MIQVEVETLIMDPTNGVPVLLLTDPQSSASVPIWIGEAEAMSIALELQGEQFTRPLTHDLIKAVLDSMGSQLKRIVIDDVDDSTFFSRLVVENDRGQEFQLDARPSDSVALALRSDASLYINEHVFEATAVDASLEIPSAAEDDFDRFIEEEMNLKDFKRFT